MKKQDKPKEDTKGSKSTDENLEGYPHYPKDDDIYNRFKEEKDIDPESLKRIKETDIVPDTPPDPDFETEDEIMGGDLDVPGAELDDEDEEAGHEDEENNYYSIGGDKHKDLEEDQGD